MTYFSLALLWLLHWLPFRAMGMAGKVFGLLVYALNAKRRHITRRNVSLCRPDLTQAEQDIMVREHFVAFAQSALDRTIAWWSSPARIKRLVTLQGTEILDTFKGQPVILLAPHFVGLDMGWTRLSLEHDMVTMYSCLKNSTFNRVVYRGRARFGQQQLLVRQDGLRSTLAAIKSGKPFYYLPDLDNGARDALFLPFFGVSTATITALSRLARLTKATVIPVITRRTRSGYVTTLGQPWANYPGDGVEADTLRMNREIEAHIQDGDLSHQAQYFWSHKRFKTRPPGEMSVY